MPWGTVEMFVEDVDGNTFRPGVPSDGRRASGFRSGSRGSQSAADVEGVRALIPLLPAWLVGLWLMATCDALWAPLPGEGRAEDSLVGGWVLLGVLVVGTLVHVAAPFLGRNLAVWSPGSATAGLGSPNEGQQAFGRGAVRAVALAVVYLMVGLFVLLERRSGGA